MRIMGSGARSIVIRFIADTARASRDMDNLFMKMKRFQSLSAKGGMSREEMISKAGFHGAFGRAQFAVMDKLISKFGLVGETGAEAFASIALKAGIAATAIYAVGKAISYGLGKVFEYGNQVQGAMLQMSQITGSERKAQYLTREAIKYSMLTPYKPAETLVATSQAIQSGIDPYKKGGYGLKKGQRAMDIFAGLGSFQDIHGNMIGLNRAVYAILKGDTRLMRPFRQLVDPAYQKAKATGAMVGTQKFNEKFIEELGKIPAIMDMAVKKSEQMQGLWSTITGFVEEVWIAFGGAGEARGVLTFWVQIEDILRDIRDAGQEIMQYIRVGLVEYGSFIGAQVKFVWDILVQIGRVLAAVLVPYFKIAWELGRQFMAIAIFVLQTVVKIARTVINIIMIFSRFLGMISGGAGMLDRIISAISEFTTGLQVMLQMASIWLDWVLERIEFCIKSILGWLTYGISNLLDKLDPLTSKLKPLLKLAELLSPSKGDGGSGLMDYLEMVALTPTGYALKKGLGKALDKNLTGDSATAFDEGVSKVNTKKLSSQEKAAIKNVTNIMKNFYIINRPDRASFQKLLDQSGQEGKRHWDAAEEANFAEKEAE